MKVQLNLRVGRRLAGKVRSDARRNNRTIDAVSEIIFGDWFSGWPASQRDKFYKQQPIKTVGSKLRSS